jgi:hypothetical protein
MSENLSNFLWGTVWLAAGALLLNNLDAIVRFDQHSGSRQKAWFKKKLGNSVLNRELWSVGTPSGFRSSRIVFRVLGIIALTVGVALVGLSFRGRFH